MGNQTLEYATTTAAPRPLIGRLRSLATPRVFAGVIAVGILCRLAQYLSDQSFWIDEAMIVLNVRAKTAIQLLGKLDHNQAAPPLFLLAERLLNCTLGGSEFSLRLLPLLCSIATLLIFAKLARRLCAPPWALLAVALLSLSDRIIWHASEVKPYTGDVLSAVILTLASIGVSANTPPVRKMPWLTVWAIPLVCFSYPAIFVFGAASLALLPALWRDGGRGIAAWIIGNVIVAAAFLLLLKLSIQTQHTDNLANYWAGDFLDLSHPAGVPLWLVRRILATCTYACAPAGPIIFFCGMVCVVVLSHRKRIDLLLLLVMPLVLLFVASAAKRYPMDGGRLTAFLAPGLLLLAAMGIELMEESIVPIVYQSGLIAAAALLGIAVGLAGFHLVVPRMRGHIRPAAQFVLSHMQARDGVYPIRPQELECYWPPGTPRFRFPIDRADRVPFHRFWIVAAFPNQTEFNRLNPMLQWAGKIGVPRQKFVGKGGAAWLFEKTDLPNPDPVMPPVPSDGHKVIASRE